METMSYIERKLEDETSFLLKVFPAEIWVKVLDNIPNTNLATVGHSSPYLAKLLTPLRTQYLFEPVLKCLIPYLPDDPSSNAFFQTCRQVCRVWCQDVSFVLQEELSKIYQETEHHQRYPKIPKYHHRFRQRILHGAQGAHKQKAFEDHYNLTHLATGKNPFVNRHLEIYSYRIPRSSPRQELILEKCGHHIWFCYFMYVPEDENDYTDFVRILSLMPNLRAITVSSSGFRDRNARQLRVSYDRPRLLPDFPVLPHLESVKVIGPQTEFVLEALISVNRQIKSVRREHRHREGDQFLYAEPMPNLEQLKISYKNMNDVLLLDNDQVNWPLKKFTADLTEIKMVKWADMGKWFQTLEKKFDKTLQNFHLLFPQVCELEASCSLNLSNLTTLSLNLPYLFPLDFILPMKNHLKHLAVRIEDMVENLEVVMDQRPVLVATARSLTNPDIWIVFGKLQTILFWHDSMKPSVNLYKRSQILNSRPRKIIAVGKYSYRKILG